MTLASRIQRICDDPKVKGRLKGEIRFAWRISQQNNGAFDEAVTAAADYVIGILDNAGMLKDEEMYRAEELLAPVQKAAKEYTLHFVSHAHIDMNWMWGYQETSNVTLDTFRTVLKLMQEYPDFTYSQSQASTYAICEELDPELFEDIKARVREGRWEVTASTWTEGDKNIPSGESLSRHTLYTKEYMKERFGLESEDLCIDFQPDTFGHSAFVPEIENEGEVKYYYHCRGEELQYAYRYKAPSGAEILCYQDPFFYNNFINEYTYESLPTLEKERGIKVGLRVYGVGDHGGGPSRRDIETIIDMQSWPISPKIIFSTYKAFFKELEAYRDILPVVDTERNFIFTGCYSSQSRIKAGNRLCEDRLYTAEALCSLSGVFSGDTSYNFNFRKAWHNVLFNQFHDILPGSCMKDSREHASGLYQQSLSYANAGLTRGMLKLAQNIDSSSIEVDEDVMTISEGAGVGFNSAIADRSTHTAAEYGSGKTRILHVFNPTNFERTEVISLKIWDYTGDIGRISVTDPSGKDLPFALAGGGDYWSHKFTNIDVLVTVKPYGFNTVVIKEKELEDLGLAMPIIGSLNARVEYYEQNTLENDKIKAVFDDDMCLISLVDKATGREMIREKAAYFEYYVENGRIHMPNAWTEGPAIKVLNMNVEGKVFVGDPKSVTPLRQSINYTLEFMSSKLYVVVSLDKDSSAIRFSVNTNWREDGKHWEPIPTMRFKVPLAYDVDKYLYDIPCGTIYREEKRHDVPAHSFAFAPDGKGRGIAVLHDTQVAFRGLDNTLSTTILRASDHPDEYYPEYGRHDNQIAVAVLDDDKMELFKAAHSFVYPMPFASVRPHKGDLPLESSLVKVDGEVIVSAIKTAQNDNANEMIVRFYSLSDKAQTVNITAGKDIARAEMVNNLENTVADLVPAGNCVSVETAPYKTVSVRLVF